jgi:hypothetical protein
MHFRFNIIDLYRHHDEINDCAAPAIRDTPEGNRCLNAEPLKFHKVSSSPSLVSLHSSPQKLVERSTIEIYGHRHVPANIDSVGLAPG